MFVKRAWITLTVLAAASSGCAAPSHDELPATVFVAILNASAPDELAWANSYCSGALVAENAVVTASHCLGSGPLPDVLIGVEDLCNGASQGDRIAVAETILGTGEASELTLLILARDAREEPAAVATAASPSADLVATGWGRTALDQRRPCKSKRMQLALVESAQCADAISAAASAGVVPGSYECMMPRGSENTCVGDSGSGVYSIVEGAPALYGITLGGLGCGAQQGGLYASPTAVAALLKQGSRELVRA